MASLRYRPNVAAIIKRKDGKIFIGERSNVTGAWQFPQGGVKKAETGREALFRELEEELSLTPMHYRIAESKGPYRYLFPPGRTKEGFDGQEQTFKIGWVPKFKRGVYREVFFDFFRVILP
jgi:putative (di)nucleoside polyphosphate hydrolase